MNIFLFLHMGSNLYAHRFLETYTDSYDVRMVRTESYSIREEEIQETSVLYKDVSETFLVVTEDKDTALKTKYIWK